MLQVKVSSLGIRGTVDGGLMLDQVIELASAYAYWIDGGPVLLARDSRPSSPGLACGVTAALSACGVDSLDLGICPTAVAQVVADQRDAAGLICVTGAHNPVQWNGLKLFGPRGRVLASAEGSQILDLWHQGEFHNARHDALGAMGHAEDPVGPYLDRLAQWVDRDAIAGAGLRVVVDAGNGAGAVVVPRLFAALGVELIPLSCEPSGAFPHPPDPTVANLAQVATIVPPVQAHAGFGLSSDCGRVAMVTERGVALGRKATLPLVAQHVLGHAAPGQAVVAGAASDSRIDGVAARHGATVSRCGVGLQEVVGRVQLERAALGGDNSGGVAVRRMHLAYDGLAVMALLLQAAAEAGGAGALASQLPEVHTRSLEVPCTVSRAYRAVAQLKERAAGEVTDLDGVRVDLGQAPGSSQGRGWYHVRVSHTEPVIRVHCEASSGAEADELAADLRDQLQSLVGHC